MSENNADMSVCSRTERKQNCRNVVDSRIRQLYVFCGIFILLGACMLLRPVLFDREEILAESMRLSLHEGVMPAVRGRIIAGDGTIIAWSERKIDLFCTETDPEKRAEYVAAVSAVISGVADGGAGKPLRSDLTAGEYAEIRTSFGSEYSLRTVSRNIRKYNGDWEGAAGTVLPGEDGIWVGVSGWEAEFEEVLSGVPGRFQVNIDPHGNWIRDTFRITLAPVQGADAVVELPVK